jgi:hypothetical protein
MFNKFLEWQKMKVQLMELKMRMELKRKKSNN